MGFSKRNPDLVYVAGFEGQEMNVGNYKIPKQEYSDHALYAQSRFIGMGLLKMQSTVAAGGDEDAILACTVTGTVYAIRNASKIITTTKGSSAAQGNKDAAAVTPAMDE